MWEGLFSIFPRRRDSSGFSRKIGLLGGCRSLWYPNFGPWPIWSFLIREKRILGLLTKNQQITPTVKPSNHPYARPPKKWNRRCRKAFNPSLRCLHSKQMIVRQILGYQNLYVFWYPNLERAIVKRTGWYMSNDQVLWMIKLPILDHPFRQQKTPSGLRHFFASWLCAHGPVWVSKSWSWRKSWP